MEVTAEVVTVLIMTLFPVVLLVVIVIAVRRAMNAVLRRRKFATKVQVVGFINMTVNVLDRTGILLRVYVPVHGITSTKNVRRRIGVRIPV